MTYSNFYKGLKKFLQIVDKKKLENENKNDNKTIPSIENDIRGGGTVEDILFLRAISKFLKKFPTAKILTLVMIVSIVQQSKGALVKELLHNSTYYGTADLYYGTRSDLKAKEIVKTITQLTVYNFSNTQITNVVKRRVDLNMQRIYLFRQLRKAIKKLNKLGDPKTKIFWVALSILLFLNSTVGIIGILEAIRLLVAEGLLPEEILEELEQ